MKFNIGDKVIYVKNTKTILNLPKYEILHVVYCESTGIYLKGWLGCYPSELFVTEQQYRKLKLKKLNEIRNESI